MPTLDLLAFQFLRLLRLAEMQETVWSFFVAGISGLGIKEKKREAFLRGETVTLIYHLGMSLGLALSWETPAALEEGGMGMIGL